MKNIRKRNFISLCAAATMAAVGVIFIFCLVGYTILGCVFELAALIVILYALLGKMSGKRPGAAKRLKMILTYGLIAMAVVFAATEAVIIAGSRSDAEPGGRYVIVLGAGVNGREPSWSLKTRLCAALRYLEDNPDSLCIVSGGKGPGEEITEAQCMSEWLRENGIEPDRIIMEEEARNTSENIKNSLALIGDGETKDGIIIVTSEYHLMRARLIAGREGARAQGIAAKTGLPVLTVNYFIREALSVWKFLIFG